MLFGNRSINKEPYFSGYYTLRELHQRAKELGLELCPVETGPFFIMQHPDLDKLDELAVGMEPIEVGGDNFGTFFIRNYNNKVSFSVGYWGPDNKHIWQSDRPDLSIFEFIFRLRKSMRQN